MAYCGPRGIPLSRFLSWDRADQEAALAWSAHEAHRCRSCGTHPDEWDPEQGGHRDALVPEPHFCRGCEQLEYLRDGIKDDADLKRQRGLHLRLTRNPDHRVRAWI